MRDDTTGAGVPGSGMTDAISAGIERERVRRVEAGLPEQIEDPDALRLLASAFASQDAVRGDE